MTFIYLMSFKENVKQSPRCASVAHMVITWRPGKYVLNCYKSAPMPAAALDTLIKTVKMLPFKQDRVKVITDNHELAWDLQNILNGNDGEFIPAKYWRQFIDCLVENNISMNQFEVSENGMMLSCEKDMARQEISQTSWGFAL